MRRPRVVRDVVRVVWRAWLAGAGYAEAGAVAGVSARQVRGWIAEAGGVIPDDLDGGSGRYLNLTEREDIACYKQAGLSNAEIARRTGRHRSTIGRELARNQALRRSQPRYRAVLAQSKAERRARRPKIGKLAANPVLAAVVAVWLALDWSPEQIAGMLRRDYPDSPEMWVSHETIYRALYVQSRGELRRELTRCLRTRRAIRRPRRRPDQRRSRGRIPDMVNISERPPEADDRAVPGHWEADLILGAGGRSAIGTLVERSTRMVMLLHLPGRHDAESVRDAMIAVINTLPTVLRRSLSYDQGSEMSRHAEITLATGLDIYFCDPHSPWQRGTNENTNGLLRQYFPKGTDLSHHSPADLAQVAALLNTRPRKTLGWDTPAEAMSRLLSASPTGVATTP